MANLIQQPQRTLLVFAPHLDEDDRLHTDIENYQNIIRHSAAFKTVTPDYFILIVIPHISAYVQRTPEIEAYVNRYTEESLKQLKRIGNALNIPLERQCLAEGNHNFEAWRIAKLLRIDTVYGYSKAFAFLLTGWETLQSKLKRTKKHIMQLWSLRQKRFLAR